MTRRFTRILAALALLVFMMPSMVGWGQTQTATITFANQTTGTSDGNNAYTTSNFVSSGIANSDVAFGTITCSATSKCYSGKVDHGLKAGTSSNAGSFTINFTALPNVTQITLNRASYSDSKTATITVKNGSNVLANAVSTPNGSADFEDMDITNLSITSLETLTVETSRYCYIKSITVIYSTGGGSTLLDNDLALNPASLSLDMYANPNTGTINYTTSSTGAVTVSASDYVTTSVNQTAKTITVTPTAVTPSAQTITVNQAADDNYAAGSKTFTVNITNSAPSIVIPEGQLSLSYEANENGSFSISFTNGFIPNLAISPTFYSDAACQIPLPTTGDAAWIKITTTDQNTINYSVAANSSTAARTAFLKVNAASNSTGEIVSISNVFTVTQAAVDYATLPFLFDGGKADIDQTNGLTQQGLGSDYTSSPYLKFDSQDDYLVLKINEAPGKLSFDIKGTGSPWQGTFDVQTSVDGQTYTNVATYTNNLGDTETKTLNNLDSDVRYIRWYFTTKVSGCNVGVGKINLAKAPEPYNLSITLSDNVTAIFVYDDPNGNPLVEEGAAGTVSVLSGTSIMISPVVAPGCVLASLVVNNENVFDQLDESGAYTFTMPSENVTISATAVVRPLEATFIFNTNAGLQALGIEKPASGSGTDLVEGHNYTLDDITMTCTHGTNTNTRVYNSSGSTDLRVYGGGSLTFTAPANYVITSITFTGSDKFDDWSGAESSHTFNASGTKKISTITVTFAMAKVILPDQWYLISSPVGEVNPIGVGNMVTDQSFALYRFDQQGDTDGKEWINYKNSTDGGFDLEFGKGYLYANEAGCMLSFTGTPVPFSNNDNLNVLPLEYHEGADFAGYNLLGNPFNETVWTDWEFYVMNDGEISLSSSQEIAPMQGFIVIADAPECVVTLCVGDPIGGKGTSVTLNVSRNRGNVIDRVRVRFGESRQLPKFQLFENSTKVYIPQNGKDYAVVRSEGQGELPVNFSASENGTYTLSMDVENMDMNYLHLIDNMTGMDVDLLQTPSYTFEAKVNDYESRFRLVFAANNNNEDGPSTGSGTFAFYSNGNWIINNAGEATLQVVDLTGRILSSETVNGSVSKTINAVPGIYMLRLINGDNVNVQKIVVR